MVILPKRCKTHDFLKPWFTNIWGLLSNCVECESFLASNSSDILALCETNLYGSFDSDNFTVRRYLPLVWKDSVARMHGLAVYEKEQISFAWDVSLENSTDYYLFFQLALLHCMFYIFFCYWSPSSLCMVFETNSSNMDKVLSINSSANVFVFGDFNNVLHMD